MGDARAAQPAEDARQKVERLFQFIRAFTNFRHPLRRQLSDQPAAKLQIAFDALPATSEWIESWSGPEDDRRWLLRVRLCPPDPCPLPPQQIKDWLFPGWEKHIETARHAEEKTFRGADGQTVIERFSDSTTRPAVWLDWSAQRETWSRVQKRHDPVRMLFANLQAIRAELQKQSEQVELVLGVGHLRHHSDGQQYDHPLVLKPMGIEFDGQTNCFTLTETDRAIEIYAEPLAELMVDLTPSGSWRESLQGLHPLDSQAGVIVKSMGDWLRSQPGFATAQLPLAPVIFLRDRGGWPARAASAVLADLATRPIDDLPPYLLRLVGLAPAETDDDSQLHAVDFVANESPDILFALPANLEQLQLAMQIERKDVVLVQGPPGTGKTHTIANLLGHLLSQGKRVLVTSHSSKSLRVLRDKVPENIQSLCVSVLDDASRSRRELEQAVQSIAKRMQEGNSSLSHTVDRLERERAVLLESIQRARADQRLCVRREYDPIVIAGSSIEPSRAAREVRDGARDHAWIPGPLREGELGKACPISPGDVQSLYLRQGRISAADETQLDAGLPTPGWLPSPMAWRQLMDQLGALDAEAQQIESPIWLGVNTPVEKLTSHLSVASAAQDTLKRITKPGPWLMALVEAGADADCLPHEWQELRDFAARVQTFYSNAQGALLEHGPEVPEPLCIEDTVQHLRDIRAHVAQGRGLKVYQWPMKALARGHWKKLLGHVRCNGEVPWQEKQFDALIRHVELHRARARLRRRWKRQVQALGGPPLPDACPEKTAIDWLPYVLASLGWFSRYWRPVTEAAGAYGKTWAEIESRSPPQAGQHPRIARARILLDQHLVPEWKAQLARRGAETIRVEIAQWRVRLNREVPQAASLGVVAGIDQSMSTVDSAAYSSAFAELERLRLLEPEHQRRDASLKQLARGASEWHRMLTDRAPGHDAPLSPGLDLAAAWRWRQLSDELVQRSTLDAEHVAERLRQLTAALQRTTGDLIAARCWARQIRVAEQFRQHLVGWLDSMRRIGQGTGRNADHYRMQAREQLKQGQRAVPVWIMPLAEVFRSLTVQDGRFDVVIVDEASQAGIGGLLAAYLGRKVVVVGDHEQVSPDAVGDDSAVAQALQRQFLEGFPSAALYDGKLSLYDLGRQTASGMLSLSEHFRCVPAIIGFSNRLSYDGKIRPLRDSSSSPLRPVVPHRVRGRRDGRQKINHEEAHEIVSLVGAMCEMDAYAARSIGVVSLLGDDQAKLVETLLRRHVAAKEIEARKIICGNAAQFQGDERGHVALDGGQQRR